MHRISEAALSVPPRLAHSAIGSSCESGQKRGADGQTRIADLLITSKYVTYLECG
jgi:hypothetical protein